MEGFCAQTRTLALAKHQMRFPPFPNILPCSSLAYWPALTSNGVQSPECPCLVALDNVLHIRPVERMDSS
jgi:hypothetical protein